jgi:uncharacterized RDD family membrane protein YckC
MAGIGASAYVLAPCPACGLDWGTEPTACRHCGQVDRMPTGVSLASPQRRFAGHLLETLLVIGTLVVGWLVWSFVAYGRSQTPAKQLLNMRVVKLDSREPAGYGTMVVREWVAKPLLGLVGGLSAGVAYFWMFWDSRNQELWDKVAGTIVVSDPEKQLAPPRLPPDWDEPRATS